MKSAASYFSVSLPLIKENLRRYWAIPAISFLAYFLSGVFPILISYPTLEHEYYFIESLLSNQYPFFMAAHLLVPVISGVVVFRYLQTTASVTSLHAMPFTRAKLFNSNVLSGLILVTLPIVLTGIVLLVIAKPVHNSYYLNSQSDLLVNAFARLTVLNWIWESFIIVLVIYAVTVFAGLVTGNSLMHIAAGFGFNFLVPGLFGIFTVYCQHYLYGFTLSPDWGSVILGLSPYLEVFDYGGKFPWFLQILYILNALVLFAVSMLLYYKRKLERTSDSFVFGFMIPVISYLIAFLGMTGLGFYFSAVGYSDLYFYAGLLSGTIIFFLIGRMIVKKTFRIFDKKTAGNLGIYALIAAVFICSFAFDLTGYEKRTPSDKRINGVSITGYNIFQQSGFSSSETSVLTTERNIAAMREFHRGIIEKHDSWAFERYTYAPYCNVYYDLTGPLDMYREYSVNYGYIKSSAALKEIYESDEYKSRFLLSRPEFLNGLSSISISDPDIYDRNIVAVVTGRSNMDSLLKCVDTDLKAQTYEEAIGFRNSYAEISFEYTSSDYSKNQRYYSGYKIPQTYKNTIAWLRENGYAEQIEMTPDMIEKISVSKWGSLEYGAKKYGDTAVPEPAGTMAAAVEITDKEQIKMILDTFETTLYTRAYYEVFITLEPEYAGEFNLYNRGYTFYYSDETVPEFIKERLM